MKEISIIFFSIFFPLDALITGGGTLDCRNLNFIHSSKTIDWNQLQTLMPRFFLL